MLKLKSSAAQRNAALGKGLRATVPRAAHGEWSPAPDRRDPLAIIDASAAGRLPYLLPTRYARMGENAFTFYRGTAAIMAADLASTPVTGLTVQLAGDAHCMNFGGFATPERNVIFDINDFDETLPGPWEWDIKRLAASMVLASRNAGLREREGDTATLATVAAYRTRMAQLAAMPALDVWYSRIDASRILDAAAEPDVRRRRDTVVEHAATEPIRTVVDKLTEVVDGTWRFATTRRVCFIPPKPIASGLTSKRSYARTAHPWPTTSASSSHAIRSSTTRSKWSASVASARGAGSRCSPRTITTRFSYISKKRVRRSWRSISKRARIKMMASASLTANA